MENIQLHNIDSVIIKKDVYADMQSKVQRFDEYEKAKCIIQCNSKALVGYQNFTHEPIYKTDTATFNYLGEDETIKELTEQLDLVEMLNERIHDLQIEKNRLNNKAELLSIEKRRQTLAITIASSLAFGLGIVFTRLIF